MSDSTNFGFARLVPGFDFLQNLAKGASQSVPQMPNLSNWIAPTLSVEELEKRIAELKAVQFWLDQNGKALGATIQALEVQKMTLATLQDMNFSMGELAEALKLKPGDGTASGVQQASEKAAAAADRVAAAGGAARKAAGAKKREAKPQQGTAGAGPVDPLQWWGALTQQFQQIATDAMKDVAQKSATDRAQAMAAGGAGAAAAKATRSTGRTAAAPAPASDPASAPAPAVRPAKKAARKGAPRKGRTRTSA